MAQTPSKMIPLGAAAADFSLRDEVTGKVVSLEDVRSQIATVVMFICNHCPFVKHMKRELAALASEYMSRGISFVAINSNDVENYPQDAPEYMREDAQAFGYPFPYLYDEAQAVARAYQAACTPDFFVFDQDLKCVYRGQFDDSRPGNGIPVTGKDLRNALDAILSGKPVAREQIPSMGCNIKWKPSAS